MKVDEPEHHDLSRGRVLLPHDQETVSTGRRRLGRGWWIAIAVAVVIAAGGIAATAVARHYAGAPELECVCGGGWLLDADAAIAVDSEADGHTQTTVPVRFGQPQGFMVWLVNRSDVTQTVLGLPPDFFLGTVRTQTRLLVAASDSNLVNPRDTAYVERAALAPGTSRWFKLVWTNPAHCLTQQEGTGVSINSIPIRVKVGAFTRTENVSFSTAIGLVVKNC